MPFSPLPAIFTEDLDRLDAEGVLELGCGHGAFTALLRERGCEPWTLDRVGPWRGACPQVVSDALHPALRGTFGVVVATNLVRHLWPAVRERGPLAWPGLVAPGGSLWILEDEPLEAPVAAANYRRFQNFLSALQPGEHGPLLAAADFRQACDRWAWAGRWQFGDLENNWAVDADRVVDMLASGRPDPGSEVAELMTSVAETGLSYGRSWWARWQPEAVA